MKIRPSCPGNCFRISALVALTSLFLYGVIRIALTANSFAIDEDNEEKAQWPYTMRPAESVHMAIMGFFALTFFFGVMATWRRDRNFYFWASLTLLGVSVSGLIFAIVCLDVSNKNLQNSMLISLEKAYKKTNASPNKKEVNVAEKVLEWFQEKQKTHNCCGVFDCKDWERIASGSKDIHESCCKHPEKNCGKDKLGECLNSAIFYKKGCYDSIYSGIKKRALDLGIELLLMSLISLAISVFLYCGACELFCLRLPPEDEEDATSIVISINGSTNSQDNSEGLDEDRRSTLVDGRPRNTRKSPHHHVQLDARGRLVRHSRAPRSGSSAAAPSGGDGGGSGAPTKRVQLSSAVAAASGATRKRRSKSRGSSKKRGRSTGLKTPPQTTGKFGRNLARSSKRKLTERLLKTVDSKSLIRSKAGFSPQRQPSVDLFRQKLEMLYDAVDKNISTLSTTPNPSGSVGFPWKSDQYQRASPVSQTSGGSSLGGPTAKQAVAPYLSHYSSVPQFHYVKYQEVTVGVNPNPSVNVNQNHSYLTPINPLKQSHRHCHWKHPRSETESKATHSRRSSPDSAERLTTAVTPTAAVSDTNVTSNPLIEKTLRKDLDEIIQDLDRDLENLELDEQIILTSNPLLEFHTHTHPHESEKVEKEQEPEDQDDVLSQEQECAVGTSDSSLGFDTSMSASATLSTAPVYPPIGVGVVRSSTLATIVEECESDKSSPNNTGSIRNSEEEFTLNISSLKPDIQVVNSNLVEVESNANANANANSVEVESGDNSQSLENGATGNVVEEEEKEKLLEELTATVQVPFDTFRQQDTNTNLENAS